MTCICLVTVSDRLLTRPEMVGLLNVVYEDTNTLYFFYIHRRVKQKCTVESERQVYLLLVNVSVCWIEKAGLLC